MTEADPTTSKYSVTIKDARGIVIGGHNTIYPTFLSDQYAPLAHKLITFTTLIEEKSQGFVGRRFVFDALDQFMERTPAGYFIVKGEAGIGKSALMAHLVQAGQYVHHFVVSTQGINRADQFLENICAQLIARYKLDRPAWLPPEASRDSAFLSALLQEVSEGLAAGEQVLILVDALDEVDWRG
ncbi:MAG: ATP-binding protein, partial [Anaerolineae bacterium]